MILEILVFLFLLRKQMAKGIAKVSSGWASWKWLSGIDAKQRMWFLGAVQGRQGFQAWMSHLVKGLQEPEFLLRFEAETDPWQRSKMVGQKISQLRDSFRKLTDGQRAELAKSGEVEMVTGLQMLGKDKRLITELVELVDPPPAQ